MARRNNRVARVVSELLDRGELTIRRQRDADQWRTEVTLRLPNGRRHIATVRIAVSDLAEMLSLDGLALSVIDGIDAVHEAADTRAKA